MQIYNILITININLDIKAGQNERMNSIKSQIAQKLRDGYQYCQESIFDAEFSDFGLKHIDYNN
jgi:hypothetical protein